MARQVNRRRGLALVVLSLGALLCGLEFGWVDGAVGRVFQGRLFGGELFALAPGVWRELAAELAPGVGAAQSGAFALGEPWVLAGWIWLVLALGAGALVAAPRLVAVRGQRTPIGVRVAAAVATLFAVSPWLPHFIATRTALGAGAYLGLSDLSHALGAGFLLLGLAALAGRPRSEAHGAGVDGPRSLLAAMVFSVLAPLFLSNVFLDGAPLTNDGVAYRFQAELFAKGDLVRDIGPLADFFPARQLLPGPEATSKYPPGHSALLALGELAGTPRLLPLLLAGLTTLLSFHLARRIGGLSPGATAWVVALSPMVLGIDSLWLSHGTSLPMGLIFLVAWLAAWDGSGRRAAVLAFVAGLALSVAFAARPLTAVALAVPVALGCLRSLDRRRFVCIGLALLGFLPGLACFLVVNDTITGSPFTAVYALYAERVSPNDRWGLINLATLLPYTAYNLARLSAWLVGVGAAGWLLIFAWQAARPKRHAHLAWSLALSLLVFYSLHRFQGVPWAGPLYLVEAVPALAVLAGGGMVAWAARAGLSSGVVLVFVGVSSLTLLAPHLRLARTEATQRRAPRAAAEALQADASEPLLVFVPLDSPAAFKQHPLPPPSFSIDPTTGSLLPERWPVLARDLGPVRNQELINGLAPVTVLYWDSAAKRLVAAD